MEKLPSHSSCSASLIRSWEWDLQMFFQLSVTHDVYMTSRQDDLHFLCDKAVTNYWKVSKFWTTMIWGKLLELRHYPIIGTKSEVFCCLENSFHPKFKHFHFDIGLLVLYWIWAKKNPSRNSKQINKFLIKNVRCLLIVSFFLTL